MSDEKTRREFLAGVGNGFVALTIATTYGAMSPAEARAQGVALQVLSESEGQTLEALGDALLPGSAGAGIAQYVDSQLASKTPLLMLNYLDFPMPFVDFYRQGLASLEGLALARHGHSFQKLSPSLKTELVREISEKNPPGWNGPPAPLFYFVTRNDAVDVYYGTQEGFAKLNIPYMAHIAPPEKW
ncbi:MAG: gluconate 2-dehydrogenase subunit 3 family protein [Limisphaerales bacterium]